MKYYTNRELSRLFKINLAKWKRWSREFLPPDPLGGLQSGYARQYHHDDALTVYLGGHLVTDLRFSIPEAKCILTDLSGWLAEAGYYENAAAEKRSSEAIDKLVTCYQVYIQSQPDISGGGSGFSYTIRGIVSEKEVSVRGHRLQQIQFFEKTPASPDAAPASTSTDVIVVRLLSMTRMYNRFLRDLTGDGNSDVNSTG
jgi:hypothetical protein